MTIFEMNQLLLIKTVRKMNLRVHYLEIILEYGQIDFLLEKIHQLESPSIHPKTVGERYSVDCFI